MALLPEASTRMSANHLKAIDRIVTAFDQAWQKGLEPPIDAYLRESPHCVEAEVLESLLRIELTCRARKGSVPPLPHYAGRFPAHVQLVSSVYQQVVIPSTTKDLPEDWFYLRNRLPVGPFSFEQLANLARSGDLRPKDLVNRRGTPAWVEAAAVPGLFSGPSQSRELKQPAPGQWIKEDYVLLELVGRGGMGEVYKGFRFTLKNEVALKIVRFDRFQKLSPPRQHQVLEDFQKEMQATAHLRHDHIVSIHDTGDHNGLPFYTMDFVDSNLAKIMQFGPLPCRKAAEYLEKVARAVEFAHQKGIVHRDIKPHNILVDAGKPILADLGLAAVMQKLFEGQEDGQIVGTPSYMAPEQARGQKTDHRTDVYGLGATLYHLITGRPPHQAPDRELTLEQVAVAEPLPPRRLNPAIDRELEAIALKCLEKEPERRYASAGLLADDLKRYLEGRSIVARKLTVFHRIHKWARREPIKAGLLGGVLLLLMILLIGGSWSNRRLRSALDHTQTERDRAETNAKEAQEERKKAADLANILNRRLLLIKVNWGEDPAKAIDSLKKHIEETEKLLEKNPLDEFKLDLADSYRTLVNLHLQQHQRRDAEKALLKCIHYQQEVAEKIQILKVDLALNYLDLGTIYSGLGEREKEIAFDLKALEILEKFRELGFNNPPILSAMAEAHVLIGIDFINVKGETEKGLQHQKDAIVILEELIRGGETGQVPLFTYQKQLGKAYQELGTSLIQKEPGLALEYYKKAMHIFEAKSQYRQNLAQVDLGRGKAHLNLKQPAEALKALDEADGVVSQLAKDVAPQGLLADQVRLLQVQIKSAQAKALQQTGDADKAEGLLVETLPIRKNLAAKPGNEAILIDGLWDLAGFYNKEKRVQETINYMKQAIALQEAFIQQAPRDPTRMKAAGIMWYDKGIVYFNNGQFSEALSSFLAAKKHEIDAFALSDHGPTYGHNLYLTYKNLYQTQLSLRQYEDAVLTIEERLQHWPKDAEKYRQASQDLARIYQRDGSQKLLKRIIAFLDLAVERQMLDLGSLQDDSLFRELTNTPEFRNLRDKWAKKAQ